MWILYVIAIFVFWLCVIGLGSCFSWFQHPSVRWSEGAFGAYVWFMLMIGLFVVLLVQWINGILTAGLYLCVWYVYVNDMDDPVTPVEYDR